MEAPQELFARKTSDEPVSIKNCEQCEDRNAEVYCFECQLKYCPRCHFIFHLKGKLRQHTIESVVVRLCESCLTGTKEFHCEICGLGFCDPCWFLWHAKGSLQQHRKKPVLPVVKGTREPQIHEELVHKVS